MKTTVLILLVALSLIPNVLAAQTPGERIGSVLERAESTGIPVSLLESKLAEGRAKGVPMERVATAVERRLAGLTRAREAMEADAPDAVDAAQLAVGADALESGVSAEVLAEISGATPGGQRAAAVAALTHLVGQGVLPDQALNRVQEALARGGPEGLANLPGFAGPPAGMPGSDNRSGQGAEAGPPSSVPAPGQGGPPDRPGPPEGPGGPPSGVPGGN